MKKIGLLALVLVLVLSLTACGGSKSGTTIRVGASPSPHSEILEIAKEQLAKEGITLEIVTFDDYVLPNTATEEGDLDANYFQHTPYLDNFNVEYNTHLVSVQAVHYEPLGIYPGKSSSLQLSSGATIAVPNDTTNEARALLLLQDNGFLTLKEGVGINATVLDIAENPLNLKIEEIEAAQLTSHLKDVDLAVINGNYAIAAGLSAKNDALTIEQSDSEAAQTYANVLVVKEGRENDEAIQALAKALTSDAVKKFIEDTYDGAVVPIF